MATSQTCCHLPGKMLNSAAECADRARITGAREENEEQNLVWALKGNLGLLYVIGSMNPGRPGLLRKHRAIVAENNAIFCFVYGSFTTPIETRVLAKICFYTIDELSYC
jgi:hypothetical protein